MTLNENELFFENWTIIRDLSEGLKVIGIVEKEEERIYKKKITSWRELYRIVKTNYEKFESGEMIVKIKGMKERGGYKNRLKKLEIETNEEQSREWEIILWIDYIRSKCGKIENVEVWEKRGGKVRSEGKNLKRGRNKYRKDGRIRVEGEDGQREQNWYEREMGSKNEEYDQSEIKSEIRLIEKKFWEQTNQANTERRGENNVVNYLKKEAVIRRAAQRFADMIQSAAAMKVGEYLLVRVGKRYEVVAKKNNKGGMEYGSIEGKEFGDMKRKKIEKEKKELWDKHLGLAKKVRRMMEELETDEKFNEEDELERRIVNENLSWTGKQFPTATMFLESMGNGYEPKISRKNKSEVKNFDKEKLRNWVGDSLKYGKTYLNSKMSAMVKELLSGKGKVEIFSWINAIDKVGNWNSTVEEVNSTEWKIKKYMKELEKFIWGFKIKWKNALMEAIKENEWIKKMNGNREGLIEEFEIFKEVDEWEIDIMDVKRFIKEWMLNWTIEEMGSEFLKMNERLREKIGEKGWKKRGNENTFRYEVDKKIVDWYEKRLERIKIYGSGESEADGKERLEQIKKEWKEIRREKEIGKIIKMAELEESMKSKGMGQIVKERELIWPEWRKEVNRLDEWIGKVNGGKGTKDYEWWEYKGTRSQDWRKMVETVGVIYSKNQTEAKNHVKMGGWLNLGNQRSSLRYREVIRIQNGGWERMEKYNDGFEFLEELIEVLTDGPTNWKLEKFLNRWYNEKWSEWVLDVNAGAHAQEDKDESGNLIWSRGNVSNRIWIQERNARRKLFKPWSDLRVQPERGEWQEEEKQRKRERSYYYVVEEGGKVDLKEGECKIATVKFWESRQGNIPYGIVCRTNGSVKIVDMGLE